jgi:hypothetical protein
MRRYAKRALAILDGAPTEEKPSPRARKGQSLVELTLTLPILLLMLLGMIEIAWLANHFLILMDVTRAAARYGATADTSNWEIGDEANLEHMDCDERVGGSYIDSASRVYLPVGDTSHLAGYHFFTGTEGTTGFYDSIACTAARSMEPLIFDTEKDDVVVSAFGFAIEQLPGESAPRVHVTGRFPARQNECSSEAYDPFDYNHNGAVDPNEDTDRLSSGSVGAGDSDATDNSENIRGYVLTGHHEVSDSPGCLGSEFSTAEIENLLNASTDLENENTPNNGLLLVEVFWHHRQLLQLGFFTAIGDDFELNVWSMYPLTSLEPTATPR